VVGHLSTLNQLQAGLVEVVLAAQGLLFLDILVHVQLQLALG
jgi:hypothetical protein